MYFANMYCYGHDHDCAGITGIRGCMGLIYRTDGFMYAVHIPDNNDTLNALGGRAFAEYILRQQRAVGEGHGDLFAFVNGSNRPSAAAEAAAVKQLLRSPETTLYRITQHLGPNSGKANADSVVVMMSNVHRSKLSPSGVEIWYKHVPDNDWIVGGKSEFAQYKEDSSYKGNKVPRDCEAGWYLLGDTNSTRTMI